MNYIPLNIKTHYELLNSLIKIEDIILFALKNNIKAIGVTDSNMFSSLEFYNLCKANDIKPIIGIELEIDGNIFLLYAKNYKGYINLCNIVSTKNIKGLDYEYLNEKKENLLCVCDVNNLRGFETLSKIFSNIYLSYENKKEKTEALMLTDKIVYMKKILCLTKEDNDYLKYIYMIKSGKTIDDEKNFVCFNNHIDLNIDAIDIKTMNSFSDLIDIEFPEYKVELPKINEEDSKKFLRSLCKKGLYKRMNGKITNEYSSRLLYEIEVIENMGYVDYFLIVYDFIFFAKKNGIAVGPGRGSAAGSLVSYVLGITDIDPIKFDLIFERFLNPDRISLPDIDVDLSDKRRDEVVEYVKNKYGKDKVANIITFGTLLPKQVIRDVGRVLNIEVSDIDNISKFIKDKDTFEDLNKNFNFNQFIKSDTRFIKLIDISKRLENLKRHTSIHAAGVVISDTPLMNKIPLYKSGNDILTGYSMNFLEELGLLKIDFLGVTALTTIDDIKTDIKKELNIDINLNNITLDDSLTLELFNKVNTVGIFQFESSGMKNFLSQLKISNFDDIVAAIALYRPGPREMIPHYIKRKESKEKINYIIPELEPILKNTYGIIIYQEQILEILKLIGGFSYSEADNIRRAMSKKKEDVILKEKEKFITSAIKKGYDKKAVDEIYELVLKFSNYGFNKSHSVAYSIVGYQMAYLKSHYKGYFMLNLLNMHIGRESKTKEYLDESHILGLEFESVDINLSSNKFIIKNKKLILPLTTIKSLGSNAALEIIEERKKGLFKDIYDFMGRTYSSIVNKKVVENLICTGAFSKFKYNKKTLIKNLDNLIEYAVLCKSIDASLVLKPELIIESEYNDSEILDFEYRILGFYVSNHPVTKYKRENMITLKKIENYFDKIVNIILLVEEVKVISTKNKEKMAFLSASDEYKKIDLTLFPRVYKSYMNISKGDIIKLIGRVEKRIDTYQIIVSSVEKLPK